MFFIKVSKCSPGLFRNSLSAIKQSSARRTYYTDALREVVSRVQVVTNEGVSAKIIDGIIKQKSPIGVDFEGIQLARLGLVQIKAPDKKIYLFRTGINRRLFEEGGLKRLLEDRSILKVMHGASGDCLSVYKENISLWPIYDTGMAHKIVNYQNLGLSLSGKYEVLTLICPGKFLSLLVYQGAVYKVEACRAGRPLGAGEKNVNIRPKDCNSRRNLCSKMGVKMAF